MQPQSSFIPAASVMFLTGLGIPVMAAVNGVLSRHVGGPIAATALLFAMGCAMATLLLLALGAPVWGNLWQAPVWAYFGAGFMVFYIASITTIGPRIGIGNAIFFVLLGQLIAAAIIDHFGLFGAIKSALTAQRSIGIVVMAIGVYLAKKAV